MVNASIRLQRKQTLGSLELAIRVDSDVVDVDEDMMGLEEPVEGVEDVRVEE